MEFTTSANIVVLNHWATPHPTLRAPFKMKITIFVYLACSRLLPYNNIMLGYRVCMCRRYHIGYKLEFLSSADVLTNSEV